MGPIGPEHSTATAPNGHFHLSNVKSVFTIPGGSDSVSRLIAEELALPELTSPLAVLLRETPSALHSLRGMIVGAIPGPIPVVEVGYVGDILSWSHGRYPLTSTVNRVWGEVALTLQKVPSLARLSMIPHYLTDDASVKYRDRERNGRVYSGYFIDFQRAVAEQREGRPFDLVELADPEVTEHLKRYTLMLLMER